METIYRVQEIRLSLVRSRRRTFQVNRSADVALAFKKLCKEVRESLHVIYTRADGGLIGIERVSIGTIAEAPAEPAEILRTALITGARSIIIVHNHPGGEPSPSKGDHTLTRYLYETAKLFKIRLEDHIIIGANGRYFSFLDSDLLPSDDAMPVSSKGNKQKILTKK